MIVIKENINLNNDTDVIDYEDISIIRTIDSYFKIF